MDDLGTTKTDAEPMVPEHELINAVWHIEQLLEMVRTAGLLDVDHVSLRAETWLRLHHTTQALRRP